ncbi:MAG TPA: PaaI family thioesterase [Rhizomicrobium sp.]
MSAAPPGFVETHLVDPFERHVGPIFETGEKGARRFGLRVDARHVNMNGIVHGGLLMTFADAALGQAAWDATDHANVVTLNMQSQFLGPARAGDWIEVAPVLVRRTRSLIFLRGDFAVDGAAVYSASSVWKILGKS